MRWGSRRAGWIGGRRHCPDGNSGSVSASRMTFMAGNAIQGAARPRWTLARGGPAGTRDLPVHPPGRRPSILRPAAAIRTSPMAMSRKLPRSKSIRRPARSVPGGDLRRRCWRAINPQGVRGQMRRCRAGAGICPAGDFQQPGAVSRRLTCRPTSSPRSLTSGSGPERDPRRGGSARAVGARAWGDALPALTRRSWLPSTTRPVSGSMPSR